MSAFSIKVTDLFPKRCATNLKAQVSSGFRFRDTKEDQGGMKRKKNYSKIPLRVFSWNYA